MATAVLLVFILLGIGAWIYAGLDYSRVETAIRTFREYHAPVVEALECERTRTGRYPAKLSLDVIAASCRSDATSTATAALQKLTALPNLIYEPQLDGQHFYLRMSFDDYPIDWIKYSSGGKELTESTSAT